MQNAAQILKSSGLRATAPRIALLKALGASHRTAGALELARDMRGEMDMVTVYRTLDAFVTAGLVKKLDFRRGHTLYERADDADHHHVVCTSCETVEEFSACEFPSLSAAALRQSKRFSSISGHSFELFGLCDNCTK